MDIEKLKAYIKKGHEINELGIKRLEQELLQVARREDTMKIIAINQEISKGEVLRFYIESLWTAFPDLKD